MHSKALFLSHGGGPMPLLGDKRHDEMIACLQNIALNLPKPDAILVVSAHWEGAYPTITTRQNPTLLYDYYGFPEASYQIQYPCQGEPSLAQHIYQLLDEAGIKAQLDDSRGLDHGVFVPLKIMYPAADIPCVQLSLVNTLDPMTHIQIGQALASLPQQNVLVIGSGFSFHNMSAFFQAENNASRAQNLAFEAWLSQTCSDATISEAERIARLIRWSEAEGARYCHPREEHLLPLHVCYGVAQSACTTPFALRILNRHCSMYLW